MATMTATNYSEVRTIFHCYVYLY